MKSPHVERNIIASTISEEGVVHGIITTPLANSTDSTLPKLIEALGGQAAYDALLVLDLKDRMGSTGYIDFLKPEELKAPVMKGTDPHGRPFISFRLLITESGKRRVETLFRRYPEGGVWVSGGTNLINPAGVLDGVSIGVVKHMMRGGEVTSPSKHRPTKFKLA